MKDRLKEAVILMKTKNVYKSNGMKKILNILSEITVNDETSSFSSARRNQRPYKRDDD